MSGLRTLSRTASDTLLAAAGVVALAALWQLAVALLDDRALWPPVGEVAAGVWSGWVTNPDALTGHLVPSLTRLLAGWLLAATLGTAAGTVIGLSRTTRDYVAPAVHFMRAIPPPALLPLFIVLLGIGDGMKVALIASGAVWPVLLNTADGVASVEPLERETARVYRIGWWDELTRIVLPSAAPKIFAGLRISLSIAIILMVISELIAAVNGVGFTLLQAQRSFRTADAWATVVVLGIIGWALNGGLVAIERRVLRRRLPSEEPAR